MDDLSIAYPACVQCGRLCVGTQHYVGALGPLCHHCADTVRQGPVTLPSGLTITPQVAVDAERYLAQRVLALEAEVERMRDALRQVRSLTNYSAVYNITRAVVAGEGDEDAK